MKVIAFGEVLWDVYSDKKIIGGAPLNFAAHLAKHGNYVAILSALGNDEDGRDAISLMEKWGISQDFITTLSDKMTGKCQVTLDSNAIPSYNLLRDVAYDYIECNRTLFDFDVLYFGTLSLRSERNTALLRNILDTNSFKDVFVDLNIREPFSTESAVRFALDRATIVKISDEELPFVANALGIGDFCDYKIFARALANNFKKLKCIIVTLGAKGAYALDVTNSVECQCDAMNVKVVSTVGAGDSFSAAFLNQYYSAPLDAALCYAARIAGYVVSNYDAVPDYNADDFV